MKIYFSVTLLLLFVFLSCSSPKKNIAMNSKPPAVETPQVFDREGHRGCRGLMPENTIPAMLHALDLGVTTLEMDICFSKDKKAILSHEPFFNHEITTKPDGGFIEEKDEKNYNMFTMDYDSIIKYDVGMKPHPRFPQQEKLKAVKPLLADLFDAVKQYMKTAKRPFPYFNIETKTTASTDNIYHPGPAAFVELLMNVIKEKGMEQYVIIQSFDYRTLKIVHEKYPAIQTALLIEENEPASIQENLDALGFMPSILSPHYALVTKELVDVWHSHHKKIIPWTVNDKKEIDRLKVLGVDGIISDYPNLFDVRF